jgi:hypothetical protein
MFRERRIVREAEQSATADARSVRRTPTMTPFRPAFGALVLAQFAHSAEEYFGQLWESFPPARFVSGLISEDLERGFLLANIALVAFGLWCWLWPIGRGWPVAVPLACAWIALEAINGIGHTLWALRQGGYTPGVGTAPVLLVLAIYLARQLRQMGRYARDGAA